MRIVCVFGRALSGGMRLQDFVNGFWQKHEVILTGWPDWRAKFGPAADKLSGSSVTTVAIDRSIVFDISSNIVVIHEACDFDVSPFPGGNEVCIHQ